MRDVFFPMNFMRTTLIAALFSAAGLVFSCGCRDKPEATTFQQFKAKAEKGDADAQNILGVCYARGDGVKQDDVEAVKWYRRAAEQNNAESQYNLGLRYFFGAGVERDYSETVKWYRRAAEQNYVEAQKSLGFLYDEGKGVNQDFVEAYAWCNLAARTDLLSAKYRDYLERKMSPQQVSDSQKRTMELRSQIEAKRKGVGK